MSERDETNDRTFARVRDYLFLGVGLGGLVYQQATQTSDGLLITAYLTLLGFPTVTSVASLLHSSGTSSRSPSEGPPSSTPSPVSSQPDGS
jgi:hypothetical protein